MGHESGRNLHEERRQAWRRLWSAFLAGAMAALVCACAAQAEPAKRSPAGTEATAAAVLDELEVKGRAPKTGYKRSQFGEAWTDDTSAPWGHDLCDTRDDILNRDLTNKQYVAIRKCHTAVASGDLHDPYTGQWIHFQRGKGTSALIQIDHATAISDDWQKGAQRLSLAERTNLANDPLNLIAVDGHSNQSKGDGDAATWLPPNKAFRCAYVSRQIAVKAKYRLWVTPAEKSAMARVLGGCPGQPLPTDDDAQQRTY
jgi:hypothetical protein